MNVAASAKHHVALVLLSVGGLSVAVGACCVVMAVVGLIHPFDGEKVNGGFVAGMFGCGAVAAIPGLFMVRSGWRMRKRAIAAGSTMDESVWTSHTENAKPTFLKDPKPRDNDF